jgi:hypothetical protein
MNAPRPNITATTAVTRVSGNNVRTLPKATAITACSANAVQTPARTGKARKRVVRTRVATIVLSGSSTANTSANVLARASSAVDIEDARPFHFHDKGDSDKYLVHGNCESPFSVHGENDEGRVI